MSMLITVCSVGLQASLSHLHMLFSLNQPITTAPVFTL